MRFDCLSGFSFALLVVLSFISVSNQTTTCHVQRGRRRCLFCLVFQRLKSYGIWQSKYACVCVCVEKHGSSVGREKVRELVGRLIAERRLSMACP